MRVSQSGVDKFSDCALAFQYSIENPVYYGGSVRAVGTAYHAGLEAAYPHRDQLGAFPPLDQIIKVAREAFKFEVAEAGDSFVWDEDIPDETEAFRRIDGMLTHYFTFEGPDGPLPWPADFEVVGVEIPWEFDHAGVTITSRGIDLVLRDPNGWIIGVDHKTTKGKMWDQFKHHPRKKAQAPLYVWAMRQLYPDAPGHRFFYDIITPPGKRETTLPKFERRCADCTDAQIAAALARVKAAAAMYEGYRSVGADLPANPGSTLCSRRYCDYFPVCPFGAVLDTPLPE